MTQPVETAVIAAAASITVGLIAAYASALQGKRTRQLQRNLATEQRESDDALAQRQHTLDESLEDFKNEITKRTRAEQAALEAEEALELFRVPLQYAAEDLGHRIHNIQGKGFLEYVIVENRRTE